MIHLSEIKSRKMFSDENKYVKDFAMLMRSPFSTTAIFFSLVLTSSYRTYLVNLRTRQKVSTGRHNLKKFCRSPELTRWTILEKEVVDEVIFRTTKPRNRLILELLARGGMRISEVLQLTPSDIEDRKLTLKNPKSGREREIVFIPQKVADRLRE